MLPDIPAIPFVNRDLDTLIQQTLDQKTKPPGSLGRLEAVAAQIARIQQSLTPRSDTVCHFVFAADHGVCAKGSAPTRPQ